MNDQALTMLISASLCLSADEKRALLEVLPQLKLEEQKELTGLFTDEEKNGDELIRAFFEEHPKLFPKYQRLTQHRVSMVYSDLEKKEKKQEEKRLEELISHASPS